MNATDNFDIDSSGVIASLLDVKGTSKEVGVNLKNGYNGDLTSRQAGSVGGQMVKKMNTVRIAKYERADRTAIGHSVTIRYEAGLCT